MTIGKAISALSGMSPEKPIMYSDRKAPREAMSYRGYYSDLAFDDQDEATVGEVLANLRHALDAEMIGYKGGEYLMREDTPIWRSEYGTALGIAWMDIQDLGDFVYIITKDVEG